MKITEIKYGYTFNKGDYSSERIDATAQLDGDESPSEAMTNLKAYVHYNTDPKVESTPKKEVPENKTVDSGEVQKTEAKPRKATKVKSTAEAIADPTPAPAVPVEPKVEPTTEAQAETTAVSAEAPGKKRKVKGSPYDRMNDIHKKLVGQVFDSFLPTWRTDAAVKSKAVAISQKLVGEDFLDAEGTVLDTFKAKVGELSK